MMYSILEKIKDIETEMREEVFGTPIRITEKFQIILIIRQRIIT